MEMEQKIYQTNNQIQTLEEDNRKLSQLIKGFERKIKEKEEQIQQKQEESEKNQKELTEKYEQMVQKYIESEKQNWKLKTKKGQTNQCKCKGRITIEKKECEGLEYILDIMRVNLILSGVEYQNIA